LNKTSPGTTSLGEGIKVECASKVLAFQRAAQGTGFCLARVSVLMGKEWMCTLNTRLGAAENNGQHNSLLH
uniref:Uncharacterized protein n=1 Tax=Balaenoptera musculus TaxID=9771 RepID=A0A8C0CA69_BALMU